MDRADHRGSRQHRLGGVYRFLYSEKFALLCLLPDRTARWDSKYYFWFVGTLYHGSRNQSGPDLVEGSLRLDSNFRWPGSIRRRRVGGGHYARYYDRPHHYLHIARYFVDGSTYPNRGPASFGSN